MAKLGNGAWRDQPSKTIITKSPGGGRTFQNQRKDGTWRVHTSPGKGGKR
ncbi:MAG: hypothetical protein LC749_17700 [Actinobacteria bacterium]|nr:hypothetical protein [Actinomycetota bacterium]